MNVGNDTGPPMELWDVLSRDERVIVLSDSEDRVIYTWNNSCTLQVWEECQGRHQMWVELEVRTLSDRPNTFEAARKAAIEWKNT